MRLLSFLFLLLSLPQLCFGQGENNIWAFGINAGLDFTTGEPSFFISASKTSEGCATACDSAGNLLFYSDGDKVYDRAQHAMPNGAGILGNSNHHAYGSSTQGVVIVPFINNKSKYYLFTVDALEDINIQYPGYLRYSIIDLSLNNGLGDVVSDSKNIIIDSFTSEKLAVAKGSGCFFWLLTHSYGANRFSAIKITEAGIMPAVYSVAGTIDPSKLNKTRSYAQGQLEVSPDHTMIAMANSNERMVELFSFNNTTGEVFDPLLIRQLPHNYFTGISFSPDNSKLYIAPNDGRGAYEFKLLQADLSLLPDTAAVVASVMPVGDSAITGAMRMGPDNKIYVSGVNNNLLHRINYPNLKGDACNVSELEFDVPDSVHFQQGFGSHMFGFSALRPADTGFSTSLCTGHGIKSALYARDGFDSYRWADGSTGQDFKPDSGGVYYVTMQNSCGTASDTFSVKNNCKGCLYIPTAFTPNNDGLNDNFNIIGQVSDYRFWVYSRWGGLLFSTNSISQAWDGSYKGMLCEVGTYFYLIKATCQDGGIITRKGDVTLIR